MAKSVRPPLVSVVMPIYNTGEYLKDAIMSILDQTFKDFELIIINDGSTDNSTKVIQTFNDERIIYREQKNKGLVTTLNEALLMTKGKYIARQDGDDISKQNRLATQVAFMESHPSVGLLGSNYDVIDGRGRKTTTTNVFTHPQDLKLAEVASNQFGHGAVMIRKSVLAISGNYDPKAIAEDFDLWVRISQICEIANIKEALYIWRDAGEGLSTSAEKIKKINESVRETRMKAFNYYIKHRSEYSLLSFKPTSTAGGLKKYLIMKNTMFRDLALLSCYIGYRRYAPGYLLLAIIYAPWVSRNYTQLLAVTFNKNTIKDIPYDYI